ncbi:MarR family winged helix-turn-helix transcriptional regulator [Actinoplanes sp. TFC3]|uniref:MarR family winged helix-turn-helix transcriptional regulator n=1 Tax=Actinoplanes sp. TFC3 TaxID=1710355 RepID=UPI00083350AD|nr:MarR family transcriptional regulator [Actinoplanes sp. TFC3]
MSSGEEGTPELSARLGYLFKHAALRLEELHREALAPYGIDGRELGVLIVLAGAESSSQHEVAQRVGSDRTTMVALLDVLERKGLVSRQPHPQDRRRNVVELTEHGRATVRDATRASDAAEKELLAPLSVPERKDLREALRRINE